jgi:hypothetical protein
MLVLGDIDMHIIIPGGNRQVNISFDIEMTEPHDELLINTATGGINLEPITIQLFIIIIHHACIM